MPPLKQDWSWHFQITFLSERRRFIREEIGFDYELWQEDEIDRALLEGVLQDGNTTSNSSTAHSVQLSLCGQRSPSMVIEPSMLHFGVVPASTLFQEDQDIMTVEKKIVITNMSLRRQRMSLISCSTDAVQVRGSEQGWYLNPGEQMPIVLSFTPEDPQVLYHAEIVLSTKIALEENEKIEEEGSDSSAASSADKGDILVVNARGYGGSSEMVSGMEEVDFGLCSLGTSTEMELTVENNGLLPCSFEMFIFG